MTLAQALGTGAKHVKSANLNGIPQPSRKDATQFREAWSRFQTLLVATRGQGASHVFIGDLNGRRSFFLHGRQGSNRWTLGEVKKPRKDDFLMGASQPPPTAMFNSNTEIRIGAHDPVKGFSKLRETSFWDAANATTREGFMARGGSASHLQGIWAEGANSYSLRLMVYPVSQSKMDKAGGATKADQDRLKQMAPMASLQNPGADTPPIWMEGFFVARDQVYIPQMLLYALPRGSLGERNENATTGVLQVRTAEGEVLLGVFRRNLKTQQCSLKFPGITLVQTP